MIHWIFVINVITLSLFTVSDSRGDDLDEAKLQKAIGLLAKLEENYRSYQNIDSLRIIFDLNYDYKKGDNNYIFVNAHVDSSKKASCQRLLIEGELFNGERLIRSYAWNGSTATSLEPKTENKGTYTIHPVVDANIFNYNYYMLFLDYQKSGNYKTKKNIQRIFNYENDEYSGYKVSENSKTIDGVACSIIEKPNEDVIFVDKDNPSLIRCRELYNRLTTRITTRTWYSNYIKIQRSWLPSKIVRETFEEALYATSASNDVANIKTITVSSFKDEPLNTDYFVIKAPQGVVVHDSVRGIFFTNYVTPVNPLPESADLVKKRHPIPWYNKLAPLTIAGCLSTILLLGLLIGGIRRKNRRNP